MFIHFFGATRPTPPSERTSYSASETEGRAWNSCMCIFFPNALHFPQLELMSRQEYSICRFIIVLIFPVLFKNVQKPDEYMTWKLISRVHSLNLSCHFECRCQIFCSADSFKAACPSVCVCSAQRPKTLTSSASFTWLLPHSLYVPLYQHVHRRLTSLHTYSCHFLPLCRTWSLLSCSLTPSPCSQ